jgi:hypothetical protein
MVLQVLYENIKDKTKILTKKRVEKVEMTDDGVVVTTSDKSSYNGDILVGADGIHSSVRGEMWRIANEMSPGWISLDEHSGEFQNLYVACTNLFQRYRVTMDAFSGSPILVRALSLAHPIQCSGNMNPMSSTAVLKVAFIGFISTSWRSEPMATTFRSTPKKTRRSCSNSEKTTTSLQI